MNKETDLANATLADAMKNTELLKQFAQAIAEGMRQAKIDPEAEAKKAKWRQRIREERRIALAEKKAREDACGHVRSDNTSCVAWYQFSDGVTRGVCQRCDKLFLPRLEDGSVDPEYVRMIKVPYRSGQAIYF